MRLNTLNHGLNFRHKRFATLDRSEKMHSPSRPTMAERLGFAIAPSFQLPQRPKDTPNSMPYQWLSSLHFSEVQCSSMHFETLRG